MISYLIAVVLIAVPSLYAMNDDTNELQLAYHAAQRSDFEEVARIIRPKGKSFWDDCEHSSIGFLVSETIKEYNANLYREIYSALRSQDLECVRKLKEIGSLQKTFWGTVITCRINLQEFDVLIKSMINDRLDVAVSKTNVLEIRRLIDLNADVNSGLRALVAAKSTEKVMLFDLLLNAHADINAKDEYGQTPLHLAAECGETDILTILLNAHAQIAFGKDQSLMSRVIYILNNLGTETNTGVKSLTRAGETPLHVAVKNKKIKALRLLLAANSDVNERYRNGDTALMRATERGYIQIVQVLLDAKADINAQEWGENGRTALHIAISNKNNQAIRMLLAYGADDTEIKWDQIPLEERQQLTIMLRNNRACNYLRPQLVMLLTLRLNNGTILSCLSQELLYILFDALTKEINTIFQTNIFWQDVFNLLR